MDQEKSLVVTSMEVKKSKILVVDDEPNVVQALEHFLSAKGYDVVGALNGEDALAILEKETADLILLDVFMPGLKGTDVAKIIKDKYPKTKVMIITGYPYESRGLYKENLYDALLIKPIMLQELYTKLADMLNHKEKSATTIEATKGMKANVLFVKAKLLFITPQIEIYNILSARLKELYYQCENYELDWAGNEKEIAQRLKLSNPDIVLIDSQHVKELGSRFTEILEEAAHKPKETLVYDLSSLTADVNEFTKLTELIRTLCIKNGLIEIKRMEI